MPSHPKQYSKIIYLVSKGHRCAILKESELSFKLIAGSVKENGLMLVSVSA